MNLDDFRRLRENPPQPNAFTSGLATAAVATARTQLARLRGLTTLASALVVALIVLGASLINRGIDNTESPIQPTITVSHSQSAPPNTAASPAPTSPDASSPASQAPSAGPSSATAPRQPEQPPPPTQNQPPVGPTQNQPTAAPTQNQPPAPTSAPVPTSAPPVPSSIPPSTSDSGTTPPSSPGSQTPGPTNSPSSPATSPSTTPTETPTGTPSETPSGTPSETPSGTPTETPSGTPTETPSGTPTETPSGTPTETPSGTPTGTPSETSSGTPTETPSGTPTETPSSPASTPAPVTPCTLGDLALSSTTHWFDADAGSAHAMFVLSNVGAADCQLTGALSGMLQRAGGANIQFNERPLDELLAAGRSLQITFNYASEPACTTPTATLRMQIGSLGPWQMAALPPSCPA